LGVHIKTDEGRDMALGQDYDARSSEGIEDVARFSKRIEDGRAMSMMCL
jgi:hypothetical protein